MSRGLWLDAAQIAFIQAELSKNKTHRAVAELAGVNVSTVDRIATGKHKYREVCRCGECSKCKARYWAERSKEKKLRDARERPASGRQDKIHTKETQSVSVRALISNLSPARGRRLA